MTIDHLGNVGVGTTAPVDQLHLASGGNFRNGHGVSRCHNFAMSNDTDYTFTIAGMSYGTAEFHCAFYGAGASCNVQVTMGGHMYAPAKYYSATVLANTKTGNATVTLSENNGNYVIALSQTSGGTTYGSYWFKASTYTDSAAVATVTWASV